MCRSCSWASGRRDYTQPQYMFIPDALCELIVCMGGGGGRREGGSVDGVRLLMDSE